MAFVRPNQFYCLSLRLCSVATFFSFSACTFSSLVASYETTVWLNLFEIQSQHLRDRTKARPGSRILWSFLEFLEQKLLVLLQTQTWVLDIDGNQTTSVTAIDKAPN